MKTFACGKLVSGLLVAVAGATWCGSAMAQPFPHHHHHYPYVVGVRPYPIVAPVVVTPPVTYSVYRAPVIYTAPPANPAPAPICVTIVNPEGSTATLSFRINGTRYVLSPGAEQELHFGGPRTLEFDRGDEFGTARVLLRDGTYRFISTDHGWALRRDA